MSAISSGSIMPTLKVSFPSVDPNVDFITGINGSTYGPPGIGIPISVLLTTEPSFWVQTDTDGNLQLCTSKTLGHTLDLHYMTAGMPPIRGKRSQNFAHEYTDENGVEIWLPRAQS